MIIINNIINYIKNQEIHHRKVKYIEEYQDFIEKFEVEYDKRYIFKPVRYIEDKKNVPLGIRSG
jgi:hypothetical protein